MALERSWTAVLQSFTANGTEDGLITVANASGFYVKQYVQITSNTQPTLVLEVKRVDNVNSIWVGPIPSATNKSNLAARTDVSAYLVSDSAAIFAPEQTIGPIRPDDIENYTYEREPTKARRVELVDQVGYPYQSVIDVHGVHRLPVDAEISIGSLTVDISYPSAFTIFNSTLVNANTEYSYALPAKTQRFSIKIQDGSAKIQFAFTVGASSTNFITIPMGCEFNSGDLSTASTLTLYYQSNKANKNIEILTWQNFT